MPGRTSRGRTATGSRASRASSPGWRRYGRRAARTLRPRRTSWPTPCARSRRLKCRSRSRWDATSSSASSPRSRETSTRSTAASARRRSFRRTPTSRFSSTRTAGGRTGGEARCWCVRWRRLARGAYATTSAEASTGTRPTRGGSCRTSKRCSTTTRSSRARSPTPSPRRDATTSGARRLTRSNGRFGR